MQNISGSGVFIKHFGRGGATEMKPYAHRDDYYIMVLLTSGAAAVEIDFDRIELQAGDILIVSPWQVHRKPAEDTWAAEGLMLAFSPELLSEPEARAIDEYAVAPHPLRLLPETVADIVTLFAMLERNGANATISNALAAAIKTIVMSALRSANSEANGRYKTITSQLRKLLDVHLAAEKSPSEYASMLNITEVYLNEAVKGATGLSVSAYIRGRVIVQAKRELTYTSMSAKEIAYALGYDDYAYFSKLFKKGTGVSPAAYRKNLK